MGKPAVVISVSKAVGPFPGSCPSLEEQGG